MATEIYSLSNPVFRVFLCHCAVVLLKTSIMSVMTAFHRLTKKIFANEEDAKAYAVKMTSHPEVERTRRAHLNDLENVLPFVLLAFLYLATNPSHFAATTHFRLFTVARLCHTVVYLLQLRQPSRALAFFVGFLVNLSMGVQVLLQFASF